MGVTAVDLIVTASNKEVGHAMCVYRSTQVQAQGTGNSKIIVMLYRQGIGSQQGRGGGGTEPMHGF